MSAPKDVVNNQDKHSSTVQEPSTTQPAEKSASPGPSSPEGSRTPPPAPPQEPQREEAVVLESSEPSKPKDASDDKDINMEIFQQIRDLDEEDDYEFSRAMFDAYFAQAVGTFKEMDDALLVENLEDLSRLGHFLKGSSAALGISKVQLSCQKIQHYGDRRDEEIEQDLTREQALERITRLLPQVKQDNATAEKWVMDYYESLRPNAELEANL